jgi:hypothetical protein
MRAEPPRHIRDIAHLYLSRMPRPGAGTVRVVVAGTSADVIPGFHVANLALAAAARGVPVHIIEASGLSASTGYFLALDPRCWVAGANGRGPHAADGNGQGPTVTAFPRVSFTRIREVEAKPGAIDQPPAGIEMVHAPPCDAGEGHTDVVAREAARRCRTIVLYLAAREPEPCPWRPGQTHPDVVYRVAFVTRAGRAGGQDGCVGTFTRWTRALTDFLPVVVRDPGSRLARQYDDAISNLLADTPLLAYRGAWTHHTSPHAPAALESR